ncbi:hypothetical protein [Arthrobacter sp. B10-11]|uniref:hypothetical protein n=1 Tax=Arthrobacter sp. B10-11 TaxID=3081160 RepID=UPI002953C7E2|nr:hypothetical protein [Arthrobacter sp. B10-11]MDV8148544.1 hypothetical protein [Arthrobacter sp. B10-11]
MTSAQISQIRSTFKKIDAAFPKPVAQAIANLDTLATAGNSLPIPSSEKLYDAAADAVLSGGDMLEDSNVIRIITAQILGGNTGGSLSYGLSQAGARRIAAALTEHADAVLAILKDKTDTAGEILASSHEVIGDLDLSESERILGLGPDAAMAWAAAKVSAQTVRECSQAWFSLADLTGFTSSSLAPSLRIADLDLATFEKVGRAAAPWDIVRAGGTIDLATRTTAKERSTGYSAALQERQDHNDGAFLREYRRTHSING